MKSKHKYFVLICIINLCSKEKFEYNCNYLMKLGISHSIFLQNRSKLSPQNLNLIRMILKFISINLSLKAIVTALVSNMVLLVIILTIVFKKCVYVFTCLFPIFIFLNWHLHSPMFSSTSNWTCFIDNLMRKTWF